MNRLAFFLSASWQELEAWLNLHGLSDIGYDWDNGGIWMVSEIDHGQIMLWSARHYNEMMGTVEGLYGQGFANWYQGHKLTDHIYVSVRTPSPDIERLQSEIVKDEEHFWRFLE
jgi:hypothetical protein